MLKVYISLLCCLAVLVNENCFINTLNSALLRKCGAKKQAQYETYFSIYTTAQIHKPGSKLDYITKVPITIIDRIDTMEMYCFTKKEDETLQTIGCLGVKPGTVFCKADIERGCYIPGEEIR